MKVMSILETSFQEKTLGWSSHVEMCNRKLLVVGEGSEHLSVVQLCLHPLGTVTKGSQWGKLLQFGAVGELVQWHGQLQFDTLYWSMMCSQWQNPTTNEHHVTSLTQETPPQMKFPVVCQVCCQWCQCFLIQFLKVSVNEPQISECLCSENCLNPQLYSIL